MGGLCVLLVAVLTLAFAQPGEVVGEAAPEAQVLDCLVDRALPAEPAVTADGGFSFQFQALAGTAVDGRSCTVHRLRNSPGGPPTPVRWLAGAELLVDKARLGRCDDGSCEWVEVARYFEGGFELSDSTLGYGLNAAQFTSVTDSLVAVTEPNLGAITASVGTEVEGTVQLADESEIAIAFTVRSRLRRADGGSLTLVYELETATPALQPGGRLALVWDAITPGGDRVLAPDRTADRAFELAPTFAGDGRVELGPDIYALELPVDALAYDPRSRLSVVERTRPDAVLLSVPMPAFVPDR